MPKDLNQPQAYDLVMGGQALPLNSSAVLGGLAGVKQRLASSITELRIAALKEAIRYDAPGLGLVIQSLQDPSEAVAKTAYRLLRHRPEPIIQRVLQSYPPYQFFDCFCTIRGHLDRVYAVAIAEDGHSIISGSRDRTIRVWHLPTGEFICTLKQYSFRTAFKVVSADKCITIMGSGDSKTLLVLDVRTRKSVHTLRGHTSGVYAVAISADERIIVSGSDDRTIKVWDLKTGKELHTLKGHTARVNSVAISADGQTIVSGSDDQTIKVWKVF